MELRTGVALINEQALWDLSAEIGANIKWAEFFIGYRSFIGPQEDLSGPFLGIRAWF